MSRARGECGEVTAGGEHLVSAAMCELLYATCIAVSSAIE